MCTRHDTDHLTLDDPDALVAWSRSLAWSADDPSPQPVPHYTTVTADDWVAGDPVPSAPVAVAEPPVSEPSWLWAIITTAGRVLFNHGKPSLEDLQRAVGGGYIERIPSRDRDGWDDTYTAYANEDGKGMGLPVNSAATIFCGVRGDIIMGDVALVGPPDDEGESTTLPAAVRQRLASEVAEA